MASRRCGGDVGEEIETHRSGFADDHPLCDGCGWCPMLMVLTAGDRRGQVWTTRSPSSSGLGLRPFKAAARVRIPLGARSEAQWRSWLARRPVTAKVAGSSPVWVARVHRSGFGPDGQVAQLVRASD